MSKTYCIEENHGAQVEGARACLAVLREIETVSGAAEHLDATWEDYHRAHRLAADVMVRAAGAASPFAAGFMAAIGEYVAFCSTQGTPNLAADGWTPLAAMSAGEFAAYRQELEAHE